MQKGENNLGLKIGLCLLDFIQIGLMSKKLIFYFSFFFSRLFHSIRLLYIFYGQFFSSFKRVLEKQIFFQDYQEKQTLGFWNSKLLQIDFFFIDWEFFSLKFLRKNVKHKPFKKSNKY